MDDFSALIVFLKNPIAGKVKTRLAKTVGDRSALGIYEQLLEITKAAVRDLEIPIRLYFDEIPDKTPNDWGKRVSVHLQTGKDLGEKMENAFSETFSEKIGCAVILGSDCPDLESKYIREAFSSLKNKDAVIGPARDGGYYLLGLKGNFPAIFSGIPWSTERVFAITLEKLQVSRKNVGVLPLLNDIDEPEDLAPYLNSGRLKL
ncbi:TIGR04282 family arsenosugar biosynthesis glycosyltransferase [Leptospira ellisii]|uniref:TIGR04282 family arsenosugar biosynthesis glycosyltransferase n=2 Tax=Leptospira ellisii TaxID=2023197 RepID=A0AAE4TWN3_9LEPT|nr:TIGR04282 family arsenosugar biosynthesis glycosyltransferase [Leptospira ellisii]MDV6234769.1 TIGR04282 family arsenosugar biosynthesis glycosyltransferase [Leptospira ellisii]